MLGDPIGPFPRWRDLVGQLVTEAARHGGSPVFFGVGQAAAKICGKLGFAVRRIGEQAIVPLEEFSIERLDPELRELHRQIANLGCQFAGVERDAVPALIPEPRARIGRVAPIRTRKTTLFSAVPFSVDYLERFPVGAGRSRGRILAFASLVGSSGRAELSVELSAMSQIGRLNRHLGFSARRGDLVGERPRLPSRKPWLGTPAGARPPGHGLAMGSAWNLPVPPRRALLGLQRAAPSQGQVCSALGAALCRLPARSRLWLAPCRIWRNWWHAALRRKPPWRGRRLRRAQLKASSRPPSPMDLSQVVAFCLTELGL